MISKGYKAIRMGKYETKKINWNDSNIIDYATSADRCDFLDIYLTSKCKFLLSDSTGNTSVLNLFRKHCLTVNEYSIHTLEHHPEKLMIYAAFDNGMMENWVPAACNQYVAIDLNVFIEQEEEN